MNHEEHALSLGKIIGNFHALESTLRIFLCESNKEVFQFPEHGVTSMPETHLTNYDTLGTLIKKYNKQLANTEQQFCIDPTLVDIRDAIAHGRVFSKTTGFPVDLFKFGVPKSGFVNVTFNQELNETWFKEILASLRNHRDNIVKCAQLRKYPSFKS